VARNKKPTGIELLRDLWDRELIQEKHIEQVIEMASNTKKALQTTYSDAYLLGVTDLGHLGEEYYSKFRQVVRWLILVRRKEGDEAFARHVATLRHMVQEEEVQS
jgi:hypothetical protein